MINLSPRTLNALVHCVNEAPVYRSGPMLVQLFNSVGFHDTYGAGFPSRSTYTQAHLEQINGVIMGSDTIVTRSISADNPNAKARTFDWMSSPSR